MGIVYENQRSGGCSLTLALVQQARSPQPRCKTVIVFQSYSTIDPDIAGEDSGLWMTCRVEQGNMTAISATRKASCQNAVRIKNAYCAAEERTIP